LLTYAKDGITRRRNESEATDIAIFLQKWSRESDGFRSLISEIFENTPGLLRDLFNIDHDLSDRLHTEIFGLYYSLLIETSFKHYFLKTFIEFYPVSYHRKEQEILSSEEGGEIVSEDEAEEEVHNLGDDLNGLIENFSIHMFTVEELTTRAVQEFQLFNVLLNLFLSSIERTLQTSPISPPSLSQKVVREKHRILTRRLYATITTNLRLILQHPNNAQVFLTNYLTNPDSDLVKILSWIEVSRTVLLFDLFFLPLLCLSSPLLSLFFCFFQLCPYSPCCLSKGMNPNIRISSGTHVDFDSSFWITAFILELDLLTLLPHLRDGFLSLPDQTKRLILASLVRALTLRVQAKSLPLLLITPQKYSFIPFLKATGESATDSEGRTFAEIFSFHAPVNRFLAGFIHWEASRVSSQGGVLVSLEDLLDVRNQPPEFSLFLINSSLDLQVLLSQIRAGMWRRNGTMLWAQSVTYKSVHSFELMFDQDVMLLQCGAVLMDRNHFVAALLGKFELQDFFGVGLKPEQLEKEKEKDEKEKKLTVEVCLKDLNPFYTSHLLLYLFPSQQQRLEEERVKAEDFLHLIITVVYERTKLGLTEEETIRRAIIHRLCAGTS
jgi:hypothetical protein